MFEFLSNHSLLVLTILGAVVSFLATFIGLVFQKKPVFILSILAVIGCVTAVTYQISSYQKELETQRQQAANRQIEKVAQLARDNIVDEINLTVKKTKITVDAIADQLNRTSIEEAATELVYIKANESLDFEETMAFAKGSPQMWSKFANWLDSFNQKGASPSLSLTVNANHHYNSGLLLAYILTSRENRGQLNQIISTHRAWEKFEAEELFLKAFSSDNIHLEWILFFNKTNPTPIAYAPAKEFARQLMVYHRLGKHREINRLLNGHGPATLANLQKKFSSIKTDVFDKSTPSGIVKLMIEKQLPVLVTFSDNKIYAAKLVRMIQLAAKE